MLNTEITLFHPNSRKREATIQSLVPTQAVSVLAERLGQEAASAATRAIKFMGQSDIDLLQIRFGDRRIRIKQSDY